MYGPMHSAETTHRPNRSGFVKPAEQCRHNMDTTGHQQEHPKIQQTMLGNLLRSVCQALVDWIFRPTLRTLGQGNDFFLPPRLVGPA
jgi:hypothetical protein